jgi:hypothetical protein
MIICEQLKEEYLKAVTTLINKWKESSIRLKNEGANDEAILENIKVNVGDVFYKMFNISYNNSCKKVESAEVELKKLYTSYLAFFDKIPAPWKEKLIKNKEYNMMEEYYKEELKLETAEEMKNLFIQYYERLNV